MFRIDGTYDSRMSNHDLALLLWQLALGFSLAATTGLRAFLPLFVGAVAAKLGYVTLGSSFAWLGSTPALVVFGTAVVLEIAADKIPALDHAFDAAGVVVKPAAATLLTASMFTSIDPVMATTLGLIGGGATAGGVHVVKASIRGLSTTLTGGIANPVVSLAEDVIAIVGIVIAFVVPVVAAIAFATIIGLATWLLIRKFQRVKATPSQAPVAI